MVCNGIREESGDYICLLFRLGKVSTSRICQSISILGKILQKVELHSQYFWLANIKYINTILALKTNKNTFVFTNL